MSKKIKHILITCALAAVFAFSAAISACTIKTKHPRAAITIEFNDVTYKIEYTLYRNMYPQTVQHFIELADAGFYNNMIIHDYHTNGEWYTGAYSYEASDEHLAYSTAYANNDMADYLNEYSKEQAYYDLFESGALTPSVYKTDSFVGDNNTVKAEDALPTLIGEFSANDHNIKKGALTADYGVLKMYYYDKGSANKQVTIKNSFDQILMHDYKYNAATSIFTIQTSQSGGNSANNYAIFARLRNEKQIDKLDALTEAIADYEESISSTNGSLFKSYNTQVDKLDSFAGDEGRNISRDFNLTSLPLIIRSVKITKY
ncbi:MAG: peptidylprolyl isomerase [Clostridia bacterium]|nr:peptidylprolyl isomerase [Clostridia bacterium]